MVFHRLVPESRGPRMLAAVATAALALSACSGGGGGGGSAGGGPVVSGGGGAVFSLTAGGVRLHIQEGGGDAANLNVTERRADGSDVSWTDTPNHALSAPTGWRAVTKVNPGAVTHRFHAVTDIASFSDADYLAYGHWAENFGKPTERPDFKPFFYGNKPYTGSIPTSTATATYTGGAAGIYETGTPGTWGYFRSAISLNANFGTGKVTATLSGFSILTALSPSFNFSNVTTVGRRSRAAASLPPGGEGDSSGRPARRRPAPRAGSGWPDQRGERRLRLRDAVRNLRRE